MRIPCLPSEKWHHTFSDLTGAALTSCREAPEPRFWRYYFACFNIAAAAAACCFAASCPGAYVCTAYVTPKLIDISNVKPKRKRVNEPRGLDCIGLLYTNFDLYCRYPCAKCL